MIQFIDTDYTFSKEKIYKQLHLKNSRAEKRIDDVFPELVRQTKEHLDITACCSVLENTEQLSLPGTDGCRYVVLCCCSCSQTINDFVNQLMEQNRLIDSYLVDHLATEIFFNASSQMTGFIEDELAKKSLHLTRRFSPGEGNIDLNIQKTVLDTLQKERDLGIRLSEYLMLTPVKTMLYYFGADSVITPHSTEHDCKNCSSVNCPYRAAD